MKTDSKVLGEVLAKLKTTKGTLHQARRHFQHLADAKAVSYLSAEMDVEWAIAYVKSAMGAAKRAEKKR